MLKTLFFLVCLVPAFALSQSTPQPAKLYQQTFNSIRGEPVDFSAYKGKILLITNTASKCGFTPQYSDLEELYAKYKDRGFLVLGFPSADFANQEFTSNKEILKFCKMNFGVNFPLFSRSSVKGEEVNPIFSYLTKETPEQFRGNVKWNFEKFLVDQEGQVVARYGSFTNPLSSKIRNKIEELLKEQG